MMVFSSSLNKSQKEVRRMAKTRKETRDAKTGQFKKTGYEKRHPSTSVRETVKNRGKKKK